jgi:8-amino-7-oxononanoate synthase
MRRIITHKWFYVSAGFKIFGLFPMKMDWPGHLRQQLLEWEEQGLARRLRSASGVGVHLTLDGQPVLSFASNDYLGLAGHPQVIRAAKEALERSGSGSTASPLLAGHKDEHWALERELAAFKRSQAALVFSSGYQAALATLGALAGPEDTIILDKLAHASLLDGAKLSGARLRAFKHNDAADLTGLLEREKSRRCLVVAETLYSMDGDEAPLAELLRITEKKGALLLLDEAHATGVLGQNGHGALENAARELPPHVIALGTLSKALASQGGFVCAGTTIIANIVHSGRALIFSTALAPAAAAAAGQSLRLIDAEPERQKRLLNLSAQVRAGLASLELSVPASSGSQIIPVILGEEKRATRWAENLLRRGIYAPAIRFPTVKKGQARLRISLSAAHTETDCVALLDALKAEI